LQLIVVHLLMGACAHEILSRTKSLTGRLDWQILSLKLLFPEFEGS